MKIYFTDSSGTPALTSWWLTPMPQSITNGVSFTITRLAGLEGPAPTRGPPLVPRNTIFVRGFACVCANTAGAASAATLPSVSFSALRRSITRPSLNFSVEGSLASAQHAVERRQADNDRGGDQGVADRAEHALAGAAEQRGAEPDADAVDRTHHEREFDGVRRDQPGQRITDHGKKVRGAEEQQDVGARNRRRKRPSEPVADDRRPAGLRQAAAKAG